jgi:hypothetical protein
LSSDHFINFSKEVKRRGSHWEARVTFHLAPNVFYHLRWNWYKDLSNCVFDAHLPDSSFKKWSTLQGRQGHRGNPVKWASTQAISISPYSSSISSISQPAFTYANLKTAAATLGAGREVGFGEAQYFQGLFDEDDSGFRVFEKS